MDTLTVDFAMRVMTRLDKIIELLQSDYENRAKKRVRQMGLIQFKNKMTAVELAKLFHDTYERLAPEYGYETREDTREFGSDNCNYELMVAVCEVILFRVGV